MSHHKHGHGSTPSHAPSGTQTQTYGYVKCKVAGNVHLQKKRLPAEVQYHLHADLTVAGESKTWDTAVNVGTSDSDDLLNYRLVPDFHHPLITTLEGGPGRLLQSHGDTRVSGPGLLAEQHPDRDRSLAAQRPDGRFP